MPGSPAGSLAGDAGSVEADDPALTWTPPHERLLAQALGLEVGDGQVPIGGLLAARAGLPRDGRVWARVSPSHWHLGTEQVTLRDPTDLALDEADARALFDAARPWFEDEGFSLEWLAPTLWLAAHPALAGLRTASLDRVTGRNVDLWLGADPQARRLRRLQSEVQMLWHTHPVNARRESEGRESVNSFWIDGCGPMPESSSSCGEPKAPALSTTSPPGLQASCCSGPRPPSLRYSMPVARSRPLPPGVVSTRHTSAPVITVRLERPRCGVR